MIDAGWARIVAWSLRGDEGNTEGINLPLNWIEGSLFVLRGQVCIMWPRVGVLMMIAAR